MSQNTLVKNEAKANEVSNDQRERLWNTINDLLQLNLPEICHDSYRHYKLHFEERLFHLLFYLPLNSETTKSQSKRNTQSVPEGGFKKEGVT